MTIGFEMNSKSGVLCLLFVLYAFVISVLSPLSSRYLMIALMNVIISSGTVLSNMFRKTRGYLEI